MGGCGWRFQNGRVGVVVVCTIHPDGWVGGGHDSAMQWDEGTRNGKEKGKAGEPPFSFSSLSFSGRNCVCVCVCLLDVVCTGVAEEK